VAVVRVKSRLKPRLEKGERTRGYNLVCPARRSLRLQKGDENRRPNTPMGSMFCRGEEEVVDANL
jgi:hypothetical protein